MTPEEISIVKKLADVWNEYSRIEQYHPSDKPEFAIHIHALQNMVMLRDAVRNHPELFPNKLTHLTSK